MGSAGGAFLGAGGGGDKEPVAGKGRCAFWGRGKLRATGKRVLDTGNAGKGRSALPTSLR